MPTRYSSFNYNSFSVKNKVQSKHKQKNKLEFDCIVIITYQNYKTSLKKVTIKLRNKCVKKK